MERKHKSIVIFGSPLCHDCVVLKEKLEKEGIKYTDADITGSLGYMKKFLEYRDSMKVFDEAKANGKVGIPFVIVNRGESAYLPDENFDINELR